MPDKGSDMEQSKSPPRRRNIALIVSLCLNIVLLPVLAAVVIRAMHRDTAIGAGGVLAPRSVMAAIPAEQATIQKVIDAHGAKLRALRLQSLRMRKEAFAVFAAPDYTPEKFAAALNRVHDADSALEAESITMMAQSLAVLTPEERRAMADRVKQRNRSWLFRMFRPRAAWE
jgi:uncharacterized membrane protein